MMIRHALIAARLCVLIPAVALAADISGRWEGSIETPNGDMQITFNFQVDGSKLTGTVESPNGEVPIEEGKVEGEHLSFKTHYEDNVIDHQGTISGDTIQLTVEGPWGKSEMILKRAKEKKSSSW